MRVSRSAAGWAVAGITLLALGLIGVVVDLDSADKVASVVGSVAALMGLGLTAHGLILGKKQAAAASDKRSRQLVERANSGASVEIVDTVHGHIRLGVLPPALPKKKEDPPQTSALSEQSVRDVQAKGSIRIVRGVQGDLDIGS